MLFLGTGLAVPFLVVLGALPQRAVPHGLAPVVDVVRTGGITGDRTRMTVYADGTAVRVAPDGTARQTRLHRDQLHTLRQAVDTAGFRSSWNPLLTFVRRAAAWALRSADAWPEEFTFELRARGRRVSFAAHALPERYRAILAHLHTV